VRDTRSCCRRNGRSCDTYLPIWSDALLRCLTFLGIALFTSQDSDDRPLAGTCQSGRSGHLRCLYRCSSCGSRGHSSALHAWPSSLSGIRQQAGALKLNALVIFCVLGTGAVRRCDRPGNRLALVARGARALTGACACGRGCGAAKTSMMVAAVAFVDVNQIVGLDIR